MQYIELSEASSIILYLCIVFATTGMMHSANRFQNTKKAKYFIFLAMLFAALPAAMRFGVGKDYTSYFEVGNQIGRLSNVESAVSYKSFVESSFSICAYYMYKLFGTSTYVIGLYAVLTQVFMILGAWEYRHYSKPEAIVFLYMCSFYWRTYNIFRQALAIAIVFWAVHYLLKNRTIPFVIAAFGATFIHKSAIVSLLMIFYFRNTEKKDKTTARVELLLPIFAVLLLDRLYALAARIPLLARYVKYYSETTKQSFITPGTFWELMILGLYVAYRLRKQNSGRCDKNILQIFDKSMACEIVFYFLSFQISHAARIGLYFTALSYCSFAYICGKQFTQYRRLKMSIYQIGFILIALAYFVSYMSSNGYGQLPYRFWVP